MDDRAILDLVRKRRKDFGGKCSKYAGTLTVEILRMALQEHGFCVSQRDVFIRGVPIEVDLVICKPDASPGNGILYEPDDVLAAIEVKCSGLFSGDSLQRIRSNFSRIRQSGPEIRCIYVTLSEREGFKHAATPEALNTPYVYTLFWHRESEDAYDSTEDWGRLLMDHADLPTG